VGEEEEEQGAEAESPPSLTPLVDATMLLALFGFRRLCSAEFDLLIVACGLLFGLQSFDEETLLFS
tara:strand:- start:713 stop:910 length:198 start_codon:yes stop_codon:yes gene_type:complete